MKSASLIKVKVIKIKVNNSFGHSKATKALSLIRTHLGKILGNYINMMSLTLLLVGRFNTSPNILTLFIHIIFVISYEML